MKADEHMAAADYKLPVIYPMKFYKMHGFSIPKDSGKRESYMGKVQNFANQTVRPGAYQITDPGSFTTEKKINRFKFRKAARQTFIDDVHKSKSQLPSPHTYSPEKRDKIEGTIKL